MPSKTLNFPQISTGHQRRMFLERLYFGCISHAPVVNLTFISFVETFLLMETSCKSPKACQKCSWLATNSCTNILNNLLCLFFFFFLLKICIISSFQSLAKKWIFKVCPADPVLVGSFQASLHLLKKIHTQSNCGELKTSGFIPRTYQAECTDIWDVAWFSLMGDFLQLIFPNKKYSFSPSPRAHRITTLNHHFIWLFCCLS